MKRNQTHRVLTGTFGNMSSFDVFEEHIGITISVQDCVYDTNIIHTQPSSLYADAVPGSPILSHPGILWHL